MYIALFVMGSLLVLASQFVRPRGEDRVQTELVELISDAQNIRAESRNLLGRLQVVGEADPSLLEQLLDYKVQFENVDARITKLVDQLPGGVQERPERGAQAELEAHARAAELAASMKPKVAEAFALIRATIAKAALQGLVRVASVSDPSLPERS